MEHLKFDSDAATILARLDRSSPDALLASLGAELLRLHEAYAAMSARLNALEVTQSLQDKVLEAEQLHQLSELPNALSIEASFALPASAGFYALEYDNVGNPFRWTGPDPVFHFEIMLNRTGPANLCMRYMRLFAALSNQKVRCYVDGDEIETEHWAIDSECEVRGLIPPREGPGATVVMFVCPRVASPADLHVSEETRKLGLAFRWLKIACEPAAPEEVDESTSNDSAPIFRAIEQPVTEDAVIEPPPFSNRRRRASLNRKTAGEEIEAP